MQIKTNISFLIPGDPVVTNRARFWARIVHGKIQSGVYSDQEDQQGYFKQMIVKQLPANFEICKGPIVLEITCNIARPKSHFGTGRNADLIKKSAPMLPQNNKDWDNYGKFVSDCLNKIVYVDDRQVFSGKAEKFYAKIACTIVKIRELNSN
jgi:Holliday junction resolvase RusA-like endonuclease